MNIMSEQIYETLMKDSRVIQITLEDDVNVPDSKSDIDQILREWGNVSIDTYRVNQDKLELKGKLDFRMLYGVSGLMEPDSLEGSIELSENVAIWEGTEAAYLSVIPRIEDLTIKAINSRKVSVRAIVAIELKLCRHEWCEAGVGVDSEDKKLRLLTEEVDITELKVKTKDTLRLRATVSLPQGKPNIGEIIWQEVNVRNINSRMTDNGIQITGELWTFVIYRSELKNQSVVWYETKTDFSEELPVSGCSQDMVSIVRYKRVSSSAEAKLNYDGELRDIAIEEVLGLSLEGYQDRRLKLLGDAYMPGRELKLIKKNVNCDRLLLRNSLRNNISGTVKTAEGQSVLQVLSVTGASIIEQSERRRGELVIEGVLLAEVMYVCSSDEMPLGRAKGLIPYRQSIQLEGAEECDYELEHRVDSISCVMTGRDELEIKGSVAIDIICFQKKSTEVVTGCELAEADERAYMKLPLIKGYICRDRETLWDIAKANSTTVELIKEENSWLSEDAGYDYRVSAGDKLLLLKA